MVFSVFVIWTASVQVVWAKDVVYDLTVAIETVNITGNPVEAMTINGGIPAPVIEATEGDTLTIHVHNTMPVATSIHWHGILLPNAEDGVPYLTTPPIKPHSSHTFSFPIRQTGTYWYHSHTGLQEQRGLYGSLVFHPRPGSQPRQVSQAKSETTKASTSQPHQMHESDHSAEPVHSTHVTKVQADMPSGVHHQTTTTSSTTKDSSELTQPDLIESLSQYDHPKVDREVVFMLSDWTNENPHEVLRNLKRGLEWYGVKKKTKQSVVGAFIKRSVWPSIKRSFKRMPPMDLSDVYYPAFLINGKNNSITEAKPGETVRLRIINGSASTYFYFNYAGEMTIIAADGLPVQPVKQDRVLMAIAETYDVLVKVPEEGMAEFQITAQDGSGSASTWLGAKTGEGKRVAAPDIPKPNLYRMQMDPNSMAHGDVDHNGHMDPMGFMGKLGIDMMDMDHMGNMNHMGKMDHMAHQGLTGQTDHTSVNQKTSQNHTAHPSPNNQSSHSNKDDAHQGHTMPTKPLKHTSMQENDLSMGIVTLTKDFEPVESPSPAQRENPYIPSLAERPFAPYHLLKSAEPSTLPDGRPVREYNFHLTGDMTRYIWTINGQNPRRVRYYPY
ncbi:MAG: multicopper oxidase domain-containing protein [Vampirovibrionales bacterium]